MKILFLAILYSFTLSVNATIVENHVVVAEKSKWDNGYPESRYHQVLDTFQQVWNPEIESRGGELVILRDWGDGAVNAWAERIGNEYILETPGGMPRYHLINEGAWVLALCHELGHLIGGLPTKSPGGKISNEGQSDYFAVQKCMKKTLPALAPLYVNTEFIDDGRLAQAQSICAGEDQWCLEILKGALSITFYFADIEKKTFPMFSKPSKRIVSKTIHAHPGSQCRLDTYLASYRCNADSSIMPNYVDANAGFCSQEPMSRPRCWYKP
jgi:hypothetical protein